MKIINFNKKNFYNELNDRLLLRQVKASSNLENSVRKIIDDVRKYGDKKLLEFAKKYDKVKISKNELKILNLKKFFSENELDFKKIKSFKKAITNLNKYHKKQFPTDYEIINNECRLQSLWKPIDSVGIYVPGGSAVYPSSLIMSIIPAKIAGVKRIVCVTPPLKNLINMQDMD